ncbi:MAG TPA: preprotein translocase subunit SecG [Chromatiales bacterium]|nr:preprotein translocase subunit SecG [Thiotrichales bacterium]HIP67111.1 preprotein translocase subunit SecG [Chromatiales bacterium]
MFYNILLVFEVLLAIALIALILLQQGKGADAGAAFGSGASGTVFGAQGAGNFLSRTTAILATLFFLNCLALAYMISHRTATSTEFKSVIEQSVTDEQAVDVPVEVNAPAAAVETSPADIPETPAEPASANPADIPE